MISTLTIQSGSDNSRLCEPAVLGDSVETHHADTSGMENEPQGPDDRSLVSCYLFLGNPVRLGYNHAMILTIFGYPKTGKTLLFNLLTNT